MSKLRPFLWFSACLIVLGISGPLTAGAVLVTLQPGPADVKDTWTWDAEDFSHGTERELRVNNSASFDQELFIAFTNLTSIPTGSTINSATLSLYRYDGFTSSPLTLGLHNVTSSWTESVSYSGKPTVGGLLSSTVVTVNGWYDWTVTSLVQGWTDGSLTNNGVSIFDSGSGRYERFASSDILGAGDGPGHPGAAFTPKLTVDYTTSVVPEPSAFLLLGAGVLGLACMGYRRGKRND